MLSTGVHESELARRLRKETMSLEMARMQIAPEQGAYMAFMAKLIDAKRYLEIGTFTGYSMLSVMQGMGEGASAVACDISEEWTAVARKYWREAGIEDKIELHLAPAEETLGTLEARSFDLVFIDADKERYDLYYEASLRLLKPGALLMIDNIFWGGAVADSGESDEETIAIRALNEKIMADGRVDASMVPIGDGLMVVKKR
jgi:predicted O-methyltransferase YrrM